MAANNNAWMKDPTLLIQAGIDPKTGLPVKFEDSKTACISKSDIKRQLRIVDEQDAVNRFTWYNLPRGINARLIERILYYRGQGILFYLESEEKFFFLPYALDGNIDIYGRYLTVTPLPFNGTQKTDDKKEDSPWVQGLKFNPVYEVMIPEDFEEKTDDELREILNTSCVVLKDYIEQASQTIISRQIINDPVLDIMAECFPFMRTALLNNTGVRGMRVWTEDESASVYAANNAITRAALEGRQNIPVIGSADFQEMTSGAAGKAEEYLLAMQSLDNYRLSLYGLDNGGLFQKKSHVLEAEQEMNTGNVGLILRDSLAARQEFCDICNSIWGFDMWCEVSETVLGVDTTGDGIAGDDEAGQKEEISDMGGSADE